jgi:hypothetical protein
MPTIEDLRYPIGRFKAEKGVTAPMRRKWIDIIAQFPAELRAELTGLVDSDLALVYRPGGWAIRQVVHHCADSHMNSLIRFKLALTEDNPKIKPYEEGEWAELPDVVDAPISWSIQILEGLHARWTFLLRRMDDEDFARTFHHPEMKKDLTLDLALDLYQWHCRHHLEHVRQAKRYQGKFDL